MPCVLQQDQDNAAQFSKLDRVLTDQAARAERSSTTLTGSIEATAAAATASRADMEKKLVAAGEKRDVQLRDVVTTVQRNSAEQGSTNKKLEELVTTAQTSTSTAMGQLRQDCGE